MSETPSSAVTTADDAVSPELTGPGAVEAVIPMALVPADDLIGVDAAADPSAALAFDDQPALDLLLRVPAMVEFILPDDAPLYAAAGVDDGWGMAPDATQLARDAGLGLDLVYDGEGGAAYASAAPGTGDVDLDAAGSIAVGDPLVELGMTAAEPAAFLPPALDAPAHVDVAVDAAARVGLAAPDLLGPELSWLAALAEDGLHVGEAWAWSDATGGYVFDHCV